MFSATGLALKVNFTLTCLTCDKFHLIKYEMYEYAKYSFQFSGEKS